MGVVLNLRCSSGVIQKQNCPIGKDAKHIVALCLMSHKVKAEAMPPLKCSSPCSTNGPQFAPASFLLNVCQFKSLVWVA